MNLPPFSRYQPATQIAVPAKIGSMPKKGRPSKPQKVYPNRIRAVREALNLSLEDVAEAATRLSGPKIAHQTLAKYEIGTIELRVRDLERIAQAMGVPAPALLNSVDPVRDEEERAALSVFRRLLPPDRERALRMMTSLLQPGSERQVS